jgi:DNA transformation protein
MATPTHEYAKFCCELLCAAGPCVDRRMFGGYGISTDGMTIALLVDLGQGETLWLKTNSRTRQLFEAAKCHRFEYLSKEKTRCLDYYSAPEAAMESAHEMAPWARLALEAALAARQPLIKRKKQQQLNKDSPLI